MGIYKIYSKGGLKAMFVKNSHQQLSLNDPLMDMPQYLKDTLFKSWAHVFQEKVFPMINEERFRVLYSDNDASRPNTPVNVIVGLLIIKEMLQNSLMKKTASFPIMIISRTSIVILNFLKIQLKKSFLMRL
jgi:hypothetical protein